MKIKSRLVGPIVLSILLLVMRLGLISATNTVELQLHAFTKATKRSDGSSAGGVGHAFVKVINNTASSVTIGYYTLSSNQYVTLGLWTNGAANNGSSSSQSNPSANFSQGVLYNEERVKYTVVEQMTDDIYCKTTLTASNISALTQLLISKDNTYDLITYNCATFASDVWNKVTGSTYWTGWFKAPLNVRNEIKDYAYYDGSSSLSYHSAYYYDESIGGLNLL